MHFLVYSDERVWTPELWTREVLYLYEADGQKTQESQSLDTQEQIRCCRSGTGQQNINPNLMKARKAGWMLASGLIAGRCGRVIPGDTILRYCEGWR
jgi:hypothetical protein